MVGDEECVLPLMRVWNVMKQLTTTSEGLSMHVQCDQQLNTARDGYSAECGPTVNNNQ